MKIKIRTRITAFIICIVLFASLSSLLTKIADGYKREAPYARQGVLDLTQWKLDEDAIKLDGEWEFYPGKLLYSKDFTHNNHNPIYVQVPSMWNDFEIEGKKFSHFGTGTYRLKVKLDNENEIYGIKTGNIRVANRIFVNGKKIGSSGVPNIDSDKYVPKNLPYASFFYSKKDTAEIIIHVSNYHWSMGGGIISSLYFGKQQPIMSLKERATSFDWILFSGFVIIAAYFACLNFMGYYAEKKKEKYLLYFALYCFGNALYSITHGENVFYMIYPHISYNVFTKLQVISIYLAAFLPMMYVYHLFKDICSEKIIKFISISSLSIMVMVIFLPIQSFFVSKEYIMYTITTIGVGYSNYILILAALAKKEGAIFLSLGTVSNLAYVIIANLYHYHSVPMNFAIPFEPFLFALSQALLHALWFSKAFRRAEDLSIKLDSANKLKDEFLAKTTHEFKTPLNGIINISESLIEGVGGSLNEEQEENLSLVVTIAKRLSGLVGDILDMSQIKYGELSLVKTRVDIKSTIRIVLNIIKFTTKHENIKIVEDISDDIPLVVADENRFKQILYNLVDNAIKYTEEGKVEIGARRRRDFVEIWVKDTGKGIEEEKLQKIFDPFYQDNDDSAKTIPGQGIGLSIVKQLVEMLDGRIWVKSKLQNGTKFSFTLPVAQMKAEDIIDDSYTSIACSNDEYIETPFISDSDGEFTVLLVDDNYEGLKVLINAMIKEGYKVIAVKSGEEALEQIENYHDFDLVILDIMMPGISGLDVCKNIRNNYNLSELPVLMLTAAIQPGDMIAAYEVGANDFLNKPFDMTRLKARAKSLIMMKNSSSKAIEMEVAFLQAQIKPHFLYNALNTIISFCWTDGEKAGELLLELSNYLRNSFDFNNINRFIHIKKEIEFIRSYLVIEKARFQEKLNYHFCFDEENLDFMIPTLLLQPIVENAVKHGILSKGEGGNIDISIENEDEFVIIKVVDGGIGISEEKLTSILDDDSSNSRVGIKNINMRMKRFYGYGIEIESEIGKGTTVSIKIPRYRCEDTE